MSKPRSSSVSIMGLALLIGLTMLCLGGRSERQEVPSPPESVPADTSVDPTLKVINWNTYHLFDHTSKIEPATAWLAEQAPDILALQEMLHIDEAGLAARSATWGHPHVVMHKTSGYPVALTSTAPINVIERVVSGFHHGYLHAQTHGIDVFVVHFWPSKPDEATVVAQKAKAIVDSGRPVIVMGDFNGLIRADETYLHAHGFGSEDTPNDYRITDALLSRGFVELVTEHSPEDLYTFGSPALIPRWAKTIEETISRRRRIDFIFASSVLAQSCLDAGIETDDETVGQWSDHYPVRCTFVPDWRRPKSSASEERVP